MHLIEFFGEKDYLNKSQGFWELNGLFLRTGVKEF